MQYFVNDFISNVKAMGFNNVNYEEGSFYGRILKQFY